jgi:glyoxylase-like metal-dependent hydrolase (beta-lactamase superfamily II)
MGTGNNCNSYFFANVLDGNSPHVIVDPGHITNEMGDQCLTNLVKLIEADDFKVSDIGLIINTHTHIDHYQANLELQEMTKKGSSTNNIQKAQIALHEEAEHYRKTGGARWLQIYGDAINYKPDFFIKEGELSLGNGENKLDLQIIHTPGHGPGHICMYWPKNKVLITGDIVFVASVGRTDLPGGDGKLLKQSIEKLSELDAEHLFTGHSTEYGWMLSGKDKVEYNFNFIKKNYFQFL